MSIYCVGDIQGCDDAFERLLVDIGFSPSRDSLYVLGDLVNRGPGSDVVLRRCMGLEGSVHVLLGNHDLHLLATAHGVRKPSRRDTLAVILQAPDSARLLEWVRRQPLARKITHGADSLLMVHAGVLPQWSLHDVMTLADEVHAALRGAQVDMLLREMYGSSPDRWEQGLQGSKRLCTIVNALTRLRFCSSDGVMDFAHKAVAVPPPPGLLPWFDVPTRRSRDTLIAFGHWSALGWLSRPDVLALDTGCVWGGCLSAVRFGATLADREHCKVKCTQAQAHGE